MGQEDVIARRYAKGLAELAHDNGALEGVRHDIRTIAGVVDPRSQSYVPEFLSFLTSPVVEPKDKVAFAATIARKIGAGSEVESFLKLLIENNRVALLPRIAIAFSDIVGPMTGVYTAVVHTARPLTDDQAGRLISVLAGALGAQVSLHQKVEPGLIAGAKIVVGDKTIDGSVLGKLDRLRHRLTTRGALDIADMQNEIAAAAGS